MFWSTVTVKNTSATRGITPPQLRPIPKASVALALAYHFIVCSLRRPLGPVQPSHTFTVVTVPWPNKPKANQAFTVFYSFIRLLYYDYYNTQRPLCHLATSISTLPPPHFLHEQHLPLDIVSSLAQRRQHDDMEKHMDKRDRLQ